MNTLTFGIFITPQSADLKALRDRVHAAEDGGFDFVAIQDHPYVPHFLDMISLIGILLGETSRIHFLSDVANLPLRPPAVLAKAAATLSLLSGGRFELGVGAGGNWPGIVSLGGRALTPKEAVEAFEEAIMVIQDMWRRGQAATLAGKHYQLQDAPIGPPLVHRPQLWFGARGPRMCALTGRLADGWIAPISTPYEAKPRSQQQIDEAARTAGRNPSEVRRMMQLVGSITHSPQTMQRPQSGPGSQPIRTTPHIWVQIFTELISKERFDSFNLVLEQESVEQIHLFATEVLPVVRELEAKRS